MNSGLLVLTPGVARVIRLEAFRSWRSLRRFGFEPTDLRQEFTIACLNGFDLYDPSRSSPTTFATHTCRRRTLQIVESARTVKRNGGVTPESFAAPVVNEHGAKTKLGDLISQDEYAIRTGRRSRPAADLLALRLDVDRVVRGLSTELAEVARLLAAGHVPSDVAKLLRISRATTYRRVADLRAAFQAAGIGPNSRSVEAA
jgi:hypothetical protein